MTILLEVVSVCGTRVLVVLVLVVLLFNVLYSENLGVSTTNTVSGVSRLSGPVIQVV